jgi:predicted transcriptional regulator of viral defense system
MRNEENGSYADKIWEKIKDLPVFKADDLLFSNANKKHINIILSRWSKSKKIVRLKKGLYSSGVFIENSRKEGFLSDFSIYIANNVYQPSYLSLEYVLYEYNILTEMPKNFTSVSLSKTAKFSNMFGKFIYHSIKKDLFTGFYAENFSNFTILKGTKSKALFDYLYFRKNIIVNRESIEELRLNLDKFSKKDKKEFEKYVRLEGSRKLNEINELLWK